MTVEKLLRELQNYPPQAEVYYLDTYYTESFKYRKAGIVEGRDYQSHNTSNRYQDLKPNKVVIR